MVIQFEDVRRALADSAGLLLPLKKFPLRNDQAMLRNNQAMMSGVI